jgi:ABC-2 type transport system ATP-binding protein
MLQVENLVKRYGNNTAVNGVSFEVKAGTSFGLLGPNGAGKSTTISLICGLQTPDAGRVLVAGYDVRKNPVQARMVMGVVPQDIALYPTLSARENLRFWGQLFGLSGKELAIRIDEVLEIAGLKDRQKERIQTFSGGMKRRINIAASLLHRPQLLIMDEPTVGIDPQSRNHILESVRALNAAGMTVVYTSHYMEEVEYLCREVAIIDHGQLIAQGSLDEVRRMAGGSATLLLEVSAADDALVQRIEDIPGILNAARQGDTTLVVQVQNPADAMAAIWETVQAAGRKVAGVKVQEPNLESVFLRLTGRALRD